MLSFENYEDPFGENHESQKLRWKFSFLLEEVVKRFNLGFRDQNRGKSIEDIKLVKNRICNSFARLYKKFDERVAMLTEIFKRNSTLEKEVKLKLSKLTAKYIASFSPSFIKYGNTTKFVTDVVDPIIVKAFNDLKVQ